MQPLSLVKYQPELSRAYLGSPSVVRLPDGAPLPELPAAIRLPDGAKAEAVTFARKALIVLTDRGDVLVYAPDGQLLRQIRLE